MKKRFALPLAAAVAASLVATPALAAQSDTEIDETIATHAQLVAIVAEDVDDAYAAVIATIEDLVASTVRSTIGNPAAIIELATPLAKAAIKGAIAQYIQDERIDAIVDQAVDSVAESELLNAVLTNEFILAVINRTVDYAVADIIASLALDEDKQATADSIVSRVWNAPRVTVGTAPTKVKADITPVYALGVGVNTSYYNYNVNAWNTRRVLFVNVNDTPKEITVTGWNEGNIALLSQGAATLAAGSKADQVVATLGELDYVTILLNAGTRALQDEIRLRVEAALLQAKTALLAELQPGLAGIGVIVTLDPADSWEDIGAQIHQALIDSAGTALDEALARLPWVVTPGEPGETFWQAIARVAQDGGAYLLGLIGSIDWWDLLFGGDDDGPTGPSLRVTVDHGAILNTGDLQVSVEARDEAGRVIPSAPLVAEYTYSLGTSCQFPTGEAPSRRTCVITATYDDMTATASVEVFDPSALATPIQGEPVPGATLTAPSDPEGWPTITRRWTRNGTLFSTAASYKLPKTEKLGNVIKLTRTATYQGLTITADSPDLVVGVAGPASLAITPVAKAVSNEGGATFTAVAKDAYGNVIPAGATETTYTYSLGEGCSFPAGEAPSRRTCEVTGTYGGVSGTATVEVFDPTALAAPIDGEAAPGSTLRAVAPEGWPTVTRKWTRNGTQFSTATSYKLPSTEKVGNVIVLTQKLVYQGLTITGSSPGLVVGLAGPASLAITPVAKAVSNEGGATFTAVAKDAYGNVIPAGATETTYTYSLGEGCSFPAGEAPSRRTCTVTGTYGGVSGTATVEVFDPTALAAPIDGEAAPGSTLRAATPEGWPTVTRKWTRNGTQFSTATSYKLPSTEKVGNVIVLTQKLVYQGLTITGTSPAATVAIGAPAAVTLTPQAKAISNAGGAQFTAVVKDAYGNVIPEGAAGTTYTYSLGEGCAFPAGEAPSRRTCEVTGAFGGASGTATVEVFDPTALAAPIDGIATPGSTLRAVTPEGWPTVTRKWTRNGTLFSTATSYKLPSAEKAGNVIALTQTLTYQGLTITGTSPGLVVVR